jgi:hypothetical protein
MYQNPAVARAIALDRVASLRQSSQASVLTQGQPGTRSIGRAARQATGWLLVEMGLRLAVPQGTLNHPVPRGQR